MEPHQHTSTGRRYWRRTDRGRLRVTGRDAVSFLQALVSNDVAALPMGGACDAVYLTPQGRMIADLRIHRRIRDTAAGNAPDSDEVIVSMPASLAASLSARLDSLVFSEDVRIEDVSASLSHITVIDGSMRDATDLFGAPPPPGIPELSPDEVEAFRIEAGIAKWGADMNEETIPLEAGLLDRAISQTKGCYVGQEVIIRVLHRGGGRVAKRLMTLRLDPGAPVPEPGTPISVAGTPVGHVTSAAFSARAGGVVALGYIKRDHAEPDTRVDVGAAPARLGPPAS